MSDTAPQGIGWAERSCISSPINPKMPGGIVTGRHIFTQVRRYLLRGRELQGLGGFMNLKRRKYPSAKWDGKAPPCTNPECGSGNTHCYSTLRPVRYCYCRTCGATFKAIGGD